MDHPEVKWLQCQIPPGDPVVDILHAVEPLEGSVVRAEGEWAPQQVIPQGIDRPPDGQALLSTVLYLASLSDSFRLMYTTRRLTPRTRWDRTAPSPLPDASACTTNGREKLGVWRRGSPQRACFTLSSDSWHCSVHWTGSEAPFQVRSVKGLVSSAKFGINRR